MNIANRNYTVLTSLAKELTFEPKVNYLFDLSYLSLIDVQGEHGRAFLQGQLSCDLRRVDEHQMQQGALCNLQGRILALLDVMDWQGLKLLLPEDLRESTLVSLAKVAMLSKVTLSATDAYRVCGFYDAAPDSTRPFHLNLPLKAYAAITHESSYGYHLGDHFYIFIVPNEQFIALWQQFPATHQRGSLAWHYLRLKHQNVEIYPLSRSLFLPHRLGLHQRGYLSFDKGCYKGQEIIARTHYRATLKHSLKCFTISTELSLTPGQKLFDAHQQEVAELIDFCPLGGRDYLLALSVRLEHPLEVFFEGEAKPILLTPIFAP